MIRYRFILLLTAVLLAAPFSGAAGGAVRRFDEGLLGTGEITCDGRYGKAWWRDPANDGLVATLYGPSSIEWNGLNNMEKTYYPFDGRIEFSFSGGPRKMALGLRIPGWCHS